MNTLLHKFRLRFMAAMSLILLISFSSSSFAADWQVALTVKTSVSNTEVYNRLVLGTDATATNGYDSVWDTYALMGGSGAVEAFFPHPEWGVTHVNYHRDIRSHAPGTDIDWDMTVRSNLSNPPFTITWSLATLPQENAIVLIDNTTQQQTDMRTTSTYDFTYLLERTFTIRITETSTCSYKPVRIVRAEPVYFDTLQEAYNVASEGEDIQSRAEVLTGDFNVNLSKSVSMTGGYNCDYSSNAGTTTITGNLNITNGSSSIEKITIQ